MSNLTNLFENLPADQALEHFETLAESGQVRIERIVSYGQVTPPGEWYDQERAEWVSLLSGEAKLEYADGRMLALKPGDAVLIPAHEKHRVAYTASPTVWLAVHFA